ncbi:MAG: hypothetical protein AB7U39_07235 [Ilumatobacteraceae bacterium]
MSRWLVALLSVVLLVGAPSVAAASGPSTAGPGELTSTVIEADAPRSTSSLRRCAQRILGWRRRRGRRRARSFRLAVMTDALLPTQWDDRVPPPWRGPPAGSVSVVLVR